MSSLFIFSTWFYTKLMLCFQVQVLVPEVNQGKLDSSTCAQCAHELKFWRHWWRLVEKNRFYNAYCDWWTDKTFLCHVKTLPLIGWNSFSLHCYKGVFCNENSQEGIARVQRSPISCHASGGKSPFSTWSKGNRRRLHAGYNKNGQDCFENSCGYTKSTIEHMLLDPGIVRRNKTTDQYCFSHFFFLT